MNCEKCDKARGEGELLSPVFFWEKYIYSSPASNRVTYLYVCNTCFDTRHEWCASLVKEICDRCNGLVEQGEFYFEPKINSEGKDIQAYGLPEGESCRTICETCYKSLANQLIDK